MAETAEKKRKKPVRLSDRTREYLKDLGYFAAFVERSYQIEKKINGKPTGQYYWQKFDAFAIADIIAVKPGEPGTLYIQTTESSHVAEHKNTILGAVMARPILQSGNRIHLHSWKKRTVNKREQWVVTVLDLQLDNNQSLYFRELGVAEHVDSEASPNGSLFPEEEPF